MSKESSLPQSLKTVISKLLNSQWLLVSIVVFSILILASYFSGKNQIMSQQQSTLLLANSTGRYFENAVKVVQALAATSPSQKDLEVVQKSNAILDSLYVIKSNGHLSAIAPTNSQLKIGMDMSGHPNFQDGLITFILSKPFISPRTGKPTVYISFPMAKGEGTLVGEFNLNGLEENLSVMKLSQGINFYITDSAGVFLSHPNYAMVNQQQNIGYLPLFNLEKNGLAEKVISKNQKLYISVIAEVPQAGWYAITETSVLSVYGVIFYPAILGLVIIILLYWIIVRREREVIISQVINPISELDRIAVKMARGDFSENPKIVYPMAYSEIVTLTKSFEYMQQKTQNYTEELRKSEEKYRTVADFTFDWEAWRLPDGSYRYVSPSCERISGHTAAEFIADQDLIKKIAFPEDRLIIEEHFVEHQNDFQQPPCHFDFRIIDTKGEIHWISHWCAAVYGDNGIFLGRRESNRDISDRIEKEQELARWGQIFEHAGWGIVVGSADGKSIEMMNPAYASMHGYDPDEIAGKDISFFFAPESQSDIASNVALAHQKGHHVWEAIHIHKDGHTFPVMMDVTTVKDDQGNVKYRVVNVQDITEKEKIENELRLSETKYFTAFRTSPDSININRLTDGLYIEINDGFTKLTKYTREDVKGKTSLELDVWDNPEDRNKLVKGLREDGLVNNLEAAFRTKTGEVINCLMSARIIEINNEQCILSITRDISERIKAEIFSKNLITMNPVSIQVLDKEGFTLEVNPAFKTLFGSVPPPDYSIFNDAQLAQKGIGEIFEQLRNGKVVQFPDVSFNPHESITELPDVPNWVRTIGFPICADNGKPERFVLMQENITEQKLSQDALLESETKYRRLFEDAAIGIFHSNIEGRFLDVNPALANMLGYSSPQEVIDSIYSISEQVFENPQLRENIMNEVFTKGEIVVVENRYLRKDGTPWTGKAILRLIKDKTGQSQIIEGFIEDITERKRVEEEIQRLNDELEQRVVERTAQLVAANNELEAFSYSVSHDLRAPLRGIDGWSLALKEDYQDKLDEKGHLYINRVRGEIQRMGQLIDGLLLLSRVTRMETNQISLDLSNMVASIVSRISEENPDKKFSIKIQPDLNDSGDNELLQIVFTNLIDNAIKFSSKVPSPNIEFGRILIKGVPTYFIKDNGAGFDMNYAKNLFGAFQRMHRQNEFEGTGVGLATVQRIINRHNGRVWAEAKVNEGATFFFTLWEEK